MLKENKTKLILTSILVLLPLLAGLLLWDRLPEQLPMHWNAAGEIDGYGSRFMAVCGMPLFLLAMHWLCVAFCFADPKNRGQSRKVIGMTLWICPVISLLTGFMTIATAMGLDAFSVNQIMLVFMGLLFIVLGNYLPKCKQNYTIGIKVVWALDNEENWNATHRFASKLWVIGGIIILLLAFLPWAELTLWVSIALIIVLTTASVLYSYLYYRKQQKEKN